MTDRSATGPTPAQWQRLMPLLREINDLKRLRTPEHQPSLAAVWYRDSAARALHASDAAWTELAVTAAARALVATRLGGVEASVLIEAHVPEADVESIFKRALDKHRAALHDASRVAFDGLALTCGYDNAAPALPTDNWIDRQIAQPRAGATAPGAPRWVLEPVESCAEHCYATAIYAVLLAPFFGADAGDAFAISLAHHAHNARLADAGFAGETLLSVHLSSIVEILREAVLSGEIVDDAALRLRPLFADIAGADTPLAQAFQTADTIDRVLQMDYFARCNRFTLDTALVDMDIVHAGPVQAFQKAQLEAAGLLAS